VRACFCSISESKRIHKHIENTQAENPLHSGKIDIKSKVSGLYTKPQIPALGHYYPTNCPIIPHPASASSTMCHHRML